MCGIPGGPTVAGARGRPAGAAAAAPADVATPAPEPARHEVALAAGMVDVHVHTWPDTFDRTVDAIAAARTARAAGLRAIVLKGGAFETVTRAAAANAAVPEVRTLGGVVFNWPMGGVNPAAVQAMVDFRGGGAERVGRVVWMPSLDARNHYRRFGIPGRPVDVFDGDRLVPAMHEVLALCARHDLVLATSHLAPAEALALIRAARAAGVERIVCTHADYDPIAMTIDEQREAARLGAYIEHAYIGVFLGPDSPVARFRSWRGTTVEAMAAAIKAVGAERCVLASDMGAAGVGTPAEGFVAFVHALLACGVTEAELDRMGRVNPAALLGL